MYRARSVKIKKKKGRGARAEKANIVYFVRKIGTYCFKQNIREKSTFYFGTRHGNFGKRGGPVTHIKAIISDKFIIRKRS